MKTTTFNLKAAVEERIGAEICPEFFQKAEQYARRKLNFINERAGREYGEDGYGDDLIRRMTPIGPNGRPLDSRNAEKTLDRLYEMCVGIEMNWESWRSRA